ncbi:MAG: 30S ribosomal protein S8 [Deltaproteobacteria bacterium]|nr:MAG: 30S ribosomal protein S8 [Deltaproteobacteria bacterium]
MINDLIGDMLTRIRNAQCVRREEVEVISSRAVIAILNILKEQGMIQDFVKIGYNLLIKLKYDSLGIPVIESLKRVSKPSLRVYVKKTEIPYVRNGLGFAIISTSRGVLVDYEARRLGIGGEILCTMW